MAYFVCSVAFTAVKVWRTSDSCADFSLISKIENYTQKKKKLSLHKMILTSKTFKDSVMS